MQALEGHGNKMRKREQDKIKVLMIGPARSVHGGVSAVVNNYYEAGLSGQVHLKYIATMVDGSKGRKLLKAIYAYLIFLVTLPFYQVLHVNMAADASCFRKKVFIDTAWLLKKGIEQNMFRNDLNIEATAILLTEVQCFYVLYF